jgi:mRNA-degrading endonuclease RelE of RelBE toxin-antitoxin system
MGYKVVLFSGAQKDFAALGVKDRERIAVALHALEDVTSNQDIKKLALPLVGYRKRVGVYRILFDIVGTTIMVHSIKHRKDAYR